MSNGEDGVSVTKREKPEIVCVLQITKKRRVENDPCTSTPSPSVSIVPHVRVDAPQAPVSGPAFAPPLDYPDAIPRPAAYPEPELRVSVICERLDMRKVNQSQNTQKVPLRNDCKLNEKKNGGKVKSDQEKVEEPKYDHNYSLPASEKNGKNKPKTSSR
jgi:hypothetical protein